MSRIYNIVLHCGCLVSEDGGGGLIPCDTDNCKFTEWINNKNKQENK